MMSPDILATLFTSARTYNHFLERAVPDSLLHEIYALMKWGPTSANCSPARIVFVRTAEAKAKLAPCMSDGNRAKTLAAPVTALIAMDMNFADKLPYLFPHEDARAWFAGNEALTASTAFRNATLQGAYLMLAARALGLDCGPMSGFDAERLNAAFFAGTSLRIDFVCNLGYGDPARLHPRLPRLPFDEACQIA